MADKPKVNTGLLYGVIADTMPMEGRDFAIETSLDENNKTKLSITPLTDIGKAFVPLLLAKLGRPMADSGVTVAGAGQTPPEVMTIRTIRRKVEEEADAARQAKLKEAESEKQAKIAAVHAAQEAAKDRAAKNGGKAALTREEMAIGQEAQKAAQQEWMLKNISEKVPGIRKAIDDLAKKAAEEDEKKGKSWTVDMDAPLTSLFDRQDVTAKFTQREQLISQMAANAVEQDRLRTQAVETAKQYIIHAPTK